MSLIKGRTDDMLIIRGVNIYPSQIEEIIPRVPRLTTDYRLVVTREGTLDALTVEVEGSGDPRELARLVKETTGCTVQVSVMPPGSVPRSEGGKLQRVHDLRQL